MKKAILPILILTLLFCTSCTPKNDTGKQDDLSSGSEYTDNYIYSKLGGIFYRFNVKTAAATPVCPDPLCRHTDGNCPFFGVEELFFSGKYIHYLKGNTEGTYDSLCRFSLEDGEFETLYRAQSGYLLRMFVYEYDIYVNQTVFESGSYVPKYNLLRYNHQSDQTEIMTKTPLDTSQIAYGTENGRVYWYSDSGNERYSTDTDYKNRIDGDEGYSAARLIGKYGYKTQPNGEMLGDTGYKLPAFRVTGTDRETGDTFTVLDGVCPVPFIAGDKWLYNLMEENAELIGYIVGDSGDDLIPVYNRRGCKMYICDADGGNKRLLCDISESGYIIGDSGVYSGSNGEWLAVTVESYQKIGERDGKTMLGRLPDAIILININTGEYKVTEIE